MGFNTGVLILNDALDQIEKHPNEFVDNLSTGIHLRGRGENNDVRAGNYINAASVFHMNHADTTGVYALGGNAAVKFLTTHNFGHNHEEEDRIKLLKLLADEMGYRIVKKGIRK